MQSIVATISASHLCPVRLARRISDELGGRGTRVYIQGGPTALTLLPSSEHVIEAVRDGEVVETAALVRRFIRRRATADEGRYAIRCGLAMGWLEPYDDQPDDAAGLPGAVVRATAEDLSEDNLSMVARSRLNQAFGEVVDAFVADPPAPLELPDFAARLRPPAFEMLPNSERLRHHVIGHLIEAGLVSFSAAGGKHPVFFGLDHPAAPALIERHHAAGFAPPIAQLNAMAVASAMKSGFLYTADELSRYTNLTVAWDYVQRILLAQDILSSVEMCGQTLFFLDRSPAAYLLHDLFARPAGPVDPVNDIDTPVTRLLQAFRHFDELRPVDLEGVFFGAFWTDGYPDPFRALSRMAHEGLLSVMDDAVLPQYRRFSITPLGRRVEAILSTAVPVPGRQSYFPRDGQHDARAEIA